MKKVMIDLWTILFSIGVLVMPVRAGLEEKEKISQQIATKLKTYSNKDSFPLPPISLTLRLTTPELVEKVETIHFTALDYQFFSLRSLRFAKEFLNEGKIAESKKYLEKADRFYKLATSLQGDSLAVLDSTYSTAQWMVVYHASRTALGFTATGLGAVASTVFDAGTLYTDYLLDSSVMPIEEAKKNLIAKAISNVLLQATGASDAVGDMAKRGWGSSRVYPVLQKIMGSSEFKDKVLKEFMRLGGDISDYAAKKTIEEILARVAKGKISKGQANIGEEIKEWLFPEVEKPIIERIEPDQGSFGTKVRIIGKNFDLAQMPITTFSPVYFDTGIGGIGGAYAKIISPRTDTEIIVEAPEGKGKVMVTVGSSNGVPFTYLPPLIKEMNPPTGHIGRNVFLSSEVTLTGKNFGFHRPTTPLIPCLLFGVSPIHEWDILEWTDNKIIFRTPIDGGMGLNIPPGLSKIAAVTAVVLGAAPVAIDIADKIDSAIALAIQAVVNQASKKGREVKVVVKTLAGESNEKKFVYPPTEKKLPTLPLPEWKEIPIEDGLATALVMDRSGSMSGEKIERARQAAYVYVDTSTEGKDMFSLAAFSSDAESVTEPISIAEGRELLKRNILSLSAGGSTNVGSGLTIALSHLSTCNLKDKRTVLMSDGRHNTGTYKPEVAEFQKRGWPIDTVAFGRDADQEMLSWVAYQTGGSFYPAETSDIASVYHKIKVLAHHGSVYRSYNDFIKTGQKLTYDIPVEPDMKKVGFFTNWQGSRMETILFSPQKTVINRSNISNFGSFVEGQTHNCFEINNPQCGNWQALITGYGLPPQGEQINFHSFCQSDVFSNVLGFQPKYSLNEEVQIGVKLAEVINGRLSPLRGAQVTAEVKKPSMSLSKITSGIRQKRLQPALLLEIFREISGLAQRITLFDDGLHQDFNPGDGIYANTYKNTTINGPYLVTITCQGSTSQGMPAKRTLQESFQVGPIEQNSFTISDFLDLLRQGSAGGQAPTYLPYLPQMIPQITPEKDQEQQTQELINALLEQLLKKR